MLMLSVPPDVMAEAHGDDLVLHLLQAGKGEGAEAVLGHVHGVGLFLDLRHVFTGVEHIDCGLALAPFHVVFAAFQHFLAQHVPGGSMFGHSHVPVPLCLGSCCRRL
jgi:hypothetical protein